MRVSAIHDSLTPGYDENCPSLAVWFTRAHVSRVPALTCAAGLYLVDRVGRRLLPLVSYAGILVSLLLLGVGFTLSE